MQVKSLKASRVGNSATVSLITLIPRLSGTPLAHAPVCESFYRSLRKPKESPARGPGLVFLNEERFQNHCTAQWRETK